MCIDVVNKDTIKQLFYCLVNAYSAMNYSIKCVCKYLKRYVNFHNFNVTYNEDSHQTCVIYCYRQTSNISRTKKLFFFRLAVAFAQSVEARC